jgi:hypothetical protein
LNKTSNPEANTYRQPMIIHIPFTILITCAAPSTHHHANRDFDLVESRVIWTRLTHICLGIWCPIEPVPKVVATILDNAEAAVTSTDSLSLQQPERPRKEGRYIATMSVQYEVLVSTEITYVGCVVIEYACRGQVICGIGGEETGTFAVHADPTETPIQLCNSCPKRLRRG